MRSAEAESIDMRFNLKEFALVYRSKLCCQEMHGSRRETRPAKMRSCPLPIAARSFPRIRSRCFTAALRKGASGASIGRTFRPNALYVIQTGMRPVTAIVAAQAVTVSASPLMAGALLWLTNQRDIMGQHRNGWGTNLAATIGLILLLAMARYTAA